MGKKKNYRTLIVARERDFVRDELGNELCLMYAAYSRGHKVSVMDPGNFYVKDGKLYGVTRRPNAESVSSIEAYMDYLKNASYTLFERPALEDFDIIFSRVAYKNESEKKDFEDHLVYLAALQDVNPNVAIINNPVGVMKAGSKIYDTLVFGGAMPETHITRDSKRLTEVVKDAIKEGKGLYGKPTEAMGGAAVFKIPKQGYAAYAELLITRLTDTSHPTIVQQELLGADRRIFLLDGEILTAYKKIPAEGDTRANITAGASLGPYEIQDVDREIVSSISEVVKREGLYFCGLDLMGPEEGGTMEDTGILELNVRCPSGLQTLEAAVREKAVDEVIGFAEKLSRSKSSKTDS